MYGRTAFYEHLAGRLAMAGYVVLLPEFFYREGPLPELTSEAASQRRAIADSRRLLRDALGAAEWLRRDHGPRLGAIGFCMGGNYALAMAAERTDLATVCYYGFPGRPIHFAQDPSSPTPIDLVPKISGPVIGFWGDQDQGAGMDNVDRFAKAMRARDAAFELHVYPGVGHGFLARSGLDPNQPDYSDAWDSWSRTLQFLVQNLSPSTEKN